MSSYEDYTTTSAHYDATREPIGTEVILGCLARGGRPLAEQVVVDAGCGTGNYSAALLAHVARIEAIDMNEGMLSVARGKLEQAEAANRIRFHQAGIDALPLEDAAADGVMTNQVLHHLPDDASGDWPLTRKVMGEFARVLRPGGGLVVNICSHEQLRRAWWVYALIAPVAERMVERHMPLEVLERIMIECGFEDLRRFVPTDGIIQGKSYFGARGPLDPAWRAGDSVWAMTTPEELAAAEARVRDMDARGVLEDFVAEHDAERVHLGQTTFLCATRSA